MAEIKVDKENMCIDRNTPEGKMLDQLQRDADSKAGTPMGEFMNQVLAYAEAGEVLSQTLPKGEAAAAIEQLKQQFEENL